MTLPATASEQSAALLLVRRFWALALRHIYLHMGSWPRIVEMMYWPLVNIFSWGFTSIYLTRKIAHIEVMGAAIVASVVLLEFFIRTTMTSLTLFMEELWSRNLGHLFSSPLSPREYAIGIVMTALVRTSIALIPLLIISNYVFGFSILSLGWAGAAYVLLLSLNGCAYGLMIVSLILRLGLSAEWLAWMATWLLIPFLAPYYAVDVLPRAFQVISYALPPTYVFESMKSQIADGKVLPEKLLTASVLTVVYAAAAAFVFWRAYLSARKEGRLLQSGE